MALLEADFGKAIQGFVSAWRVSSIGLDKVGSEDEDGKRNGWDDVQVEEKVSFFCLEIISNYRSLIMFAISTIERMERRNG
jgi:hypothetical protein